MALTRTQLNGCDARHWGVQQLQCSVRPPCSLADGMTAASNVCRPAGLVQLKLTDPMIAAWWCGFGAGGGPDVCRCVRCGINMGARNPRQLCGKWRCRSTEPPWSFVNTGGGCSDSDEILVEETDYDSAAL